MASLKQKKSMKCICKVSRVGRKGQCCEMGMLTYWIPPCLNLYSVFVFAKVTFTSEESPLPDQYISVEVIFLISALNIAQLNSILFRNFYFLEKKKFNLGLYG